MSEKIEEFTLHFRTQREWEFLAILDLFLAGAGAGLFLLGLFLGLSLAVIIGVIATALGAVALLADLGRPERFWKAVYKPGSSWISRGTILVAVFIVFGALYAAPTIPWLQWLPWTTNTGFGLVARWIAGLAALGVMAYTGFLLAFSPAIPAWNNPLLPILFIAFSLLTGMGIIYLITLGLSTGAVNLPVWEGIGLGLILTSLILVLAYMATMTSSTVAAREAIRYLVCGDLALPFVGGVLVVGLVVPLILAAILYLGNVPLASARVPLAFTGGLLVIGGLCLRYSLLKAGIFQPMV